MIAGAIIFAVGALTGWCLARPLRRQRPPAVPTCQCRHPLAVHDPRTNRCDEMIRRRATDTSFSRWEQCPCRRYVGPVPLSSVFDQGIALPEADA